MSIPHLGSWVWALKDFFLVIWDDFFVDGRLWSRGRSLSSTAPAQNQEKQTRNSIDKRRTFEHINDADVTGGKAGGEGEEETFEETISTSGSSSV